VGKRKEGRKEIGGTQWLNFVGPLDLSLEEPLTSQNHKPKKEKRATDEGEVLESG